MHYQNDLFTPSYKRSCHRQPGLYDGRTARTGLSCSECGSELIETESYLACPLGHGRLMIDSERNARDAERQHERDLLHGID